MQRIFPNEFILFGATASCWTRISRNTFLHNEVEFLLREELREPRDYYVILRAIAQGKRKLAEIMNDTGFDKAHLSRYLDILRSLGFVEKEVAVTEKSPEKSRLGLYRLHDRFFAIWFGECKWSGKKVGTDVYQDLRRKSKLVEWHAGKRNERFILFSRSGFTPSMLDVAKRGKVVLVEGERTIR